MAYSSKSLTSFSDSVFFGRRRADLADDRRSATLTVAEVRCAAAFFGALLKTSVKASGHLLKDVPSSMADSTWYSVSMTEGCKIQPDRSHQLGTD